MISRPCGAVGHEATGFAFEEALETAPPPSASPSRHPRELSRADPSGEVLPLECPGSGPCVQHGPPYPKPSHPSSWLMVVFI